jgi:hypothetical protein
MYILICQNIHCFPLLRVLANSFEKGGTRHKPSWPNVRYYHGVFREWLNKTAENLSTVGDVSEIFRPDRPRVRSQKDLKELALILQDLLRMYIHNECLHPLWIMNDLLQLWTVSVCKRFPRRIPPCLRIDKKIVVWLSLGFRSWTVVNHLWC